MTQTNPNKDLALQMLSVLDDVELSYRDVAEIAVNVYGFLMQECGLTMHDAVGGVMEYYKTNANHRQ